MIAGTRLARNIKINESENSGRDAVICLILRACFQPTDIVSQPEKHLLVERLRPIRAARSLDDSYAVYNLDYPSKVQYAFKRSTETIGAWTSDNLAKVHIGVHFSKKNLFIKFVTFFEYVEVLSIWSIEIAHIGIYLTITPDIRTSSPG